jgi:hypothetical protein
MVDLCFISSPAAFLATFQSPRSPSVSTLPAELFPAAPAAPAHHVWPVLSAKHRVPAFRGKLFFAYNDADPFKRVNALHARVFARFLFFAGREVVSHTVSGLATCLVSFFFAALVPIFSALFVRGRFTSYDYTLFL